MTDPMAIDGALAAAAANAPAAAPPPVQPPAAAPADTPAAAPADPGPRPALTFGEAIPEPSTGNPVPPDDDASTWDVLGAAWKDETIRTDAWGYEDRQRRALAEAMYQRLPEDARKRIEDTQAFYGPSWRPFAELVAEEAGRAAAAGPEAAADWAGFPLSPEAFDQRMRADRDAELAAAGRILDQPGGTIAAFTGAAARALTDPISIAMLPLGVSGGAMRTILAEAALGGLGEAAVLPREFEVAERLDLPDPNVTQRVLLGAAAGGALSGAVIGIAKGVNLLRARRAGARAAMPPDADPLEYEAELDAAEAALRGEPGPVTPPAPPPPTPGTMGAVLADLPDEGPGDITAVVNAIIGVESGGRANAANPNSTAVGLGQFIASTWIDMIQRHRPSLMQGRTRNEVLALRTNPTLSWQITGLYVRENQQKLKAAGVPAGPGETYLAHFMGPGGAIRALRAPPETPITQLMTPKEIKANQGIRFNGKSFGKFTAYDLRLWARSKMARNGATGGPASDVPTYTPTTRGYTGTGQVAVGDSMRIDVDYQVVDVSSLTRASGEFQPRDRSRGTSDAWIADTAARLDPAQLMPSPTADRGAPIVGPDNMIESGSGRFGAIQRAYARHPDRAAAYRAQIEAAGFTIPEGVSQPVLIARRTTDLSRADRIRMTVDAQDSGVAMMTPSEIARAQSQAMTPGVLARLDPGQPIAAEGNADFVRAALSALPRSARNAMFDATGMLNREGDRLLRQAIFARAWPDPDIVARATETDAGDLKGLFTALEQSAPDWAALKADIAAGTVMPEMDIGSFVLDAMRMIATARDLAARDGGKVATVLNDMLAEVDLLEGPVSPLTAAMVRRFYPERRPAKAEDIAALLSRYAQDARKAGQTGALFDAPNPRDILATLDARAFGDLPQDIGAARGRMVPDPPADPAPLPDQGYDTGAASPEAETADATAREALETPSNNGLTNAAEFRLLKGAGVFDAYRAQIAEAGSPDDLAAALQAYEAAVNARRKLKSSAPVEQRVARDRAEKTASAAVNAFRPKTDDALARALTDAGFAGQLAPNPELTGELGVIDPAGRWTNAILHGEATAAEIVQGPEFAALRAAVWDQPAPARAADTPAAPDDIPADLRADLDALDIELPDGTRITARQMLDDLDSDTATAAVIDACGITPTGA